MPSTLDRLKQRKVVEWVLAYCAGAWLVMQFVEVLSGRWPIPLELQRGIDLSLVVGLFVAITLAWYHGEKGRQRVSGPELLILALLLFVGGLWLARLDTGFIRPDVMESGESATPVPAQGAHSVAVLPLRNLSGNPDQDYLVSGMHESLITSLSHIRPLRVISRTSVMRYADTQSPISTIADELGVDTLVEGSVNPIGSRVRITVQLIDAETASTLWSRHYDRDLRDVLVLISQVAESVAEQVEVVLAPDEAARLNSARPVDPALYEIYSKGRHFLNLLSRPALEQAIEAFEQAIEMNPDFAPAWAGLSGTQVLRAYQGFVDANPGLDQAEHAARQALRRDDRSAEAHAALGWVHFLRFQWLESRREFARALELNPNDPTALHGYGDHLTITGSLDDGLAFVKRAAENDPFSPLWGHTVIAHLYVMGRYQEAIAEADEVFALNPLAPVWGWRGRANWLLGRQEPAIDDFRKALDSRPALLAQLDLGLARGGPVEALRACAEAAAARAGERGALGVAQWYALIQDGPQTLVWIDRAVRQRAPELVYLAIRPEFAFLFEDPAFAELMNHLGLPQPAR